MARNMEDTDVESLPTYGVHPISDDSAKQLPRLRVTGVIPKCWHLLGRFWRILSYRWWWWEIASLIISITATGAVLLILCKINGLSLDQWTFPIQANSLVSVFLTISKSALLVPVAECISQAKWMQFSNKPHKLSKLQEYDDASRGPWGAAILLLRKAGWIAWLGALLTVISLALDPFVQQIIEFPSRPVALASGRAEISATQSIDRIDLPSMRGAILSAIYSPKEDPGSPLTYTCTTSSCLWNQTITSVGPTMHHSPWPLYPNPDKLEQTWSFATTTCIYTMDAEANVTLTAHIQTITFPGRDGRPTEYASQCTQIRIDSQLGLGGQSSLKPLTLSRLLDPKVRWVATALTYTTNYDKDRRRMPNMTINDLAPEINLCGMYLCAQTYDHTLAVVNGSLINTEPTSTVPLGNILSEDNGRAELVPIADGQNAEVLVPLAESTVINYSNLSSDASSPTESDPISRNNGTIPILEVDRFTISQQAIFTLHARLHREILNISQSSGNIDFGAAFPEPNYGVDMSALRASQASSQSAYSSPSDATFVNVSATFGRLARGITARLWVENGSRLVKGDALHEETFFRVAWGWVVLLVGVVVLAVGLLAGTIWASSPSSSLLRGLMAGFWKRMGMRMSRAECQGGDGFDDGKPTGATGSEDLGIGAVREVVDSTGREEKECGKGDVITTEQDLDDESLGKTEGRPSIGNGRGEVGRKPGIWKGSSLALLISSLEMQDVDGTIARGSLQEELSTIHNLEDLERFADGKMVGLVEGGLGNDDDVTPSSGRRFVIVSKA